MIVGVLGATALTGTALAFWTASSTGNGRVNASGMTAPTVTVVPTSTSSVDVSWTPSGPAGATPTYTVVRDGAVTVCSATPWTSCTDTGLAPESTHSYVVTATLGTSWTTSGSGSGSTSALGGLTFNTTPNACGAQLAVGTTQVTGTITRGTSSASALVVSLTTTVGNFGEPATTTTQVTIPANQTVSDVFTLSGLADGASGTVTGSAAEFANATCSISVASGPTDTTKPSVTIDQASNQSDPTSGATVSFTVVFSETVTGFDASDVILTGTAVTGSTTKTLSGTGPTYTITVSNMAADGTVIATIPANAAADAAGNTSNASTSLDNSVTRATSDTTKPTPTAVTLVNGGSTAGTVEKGDRIEISYSEAIKPNSFCSAWSPTPADADIFVNGTPGITVTIAANDVLTVSTGTCTFNLGSISLGGNYVTADKSFGGNNENRSRIQWNSATNVLTITLGATNNTSNLGSSVAAAAPIYSPSTAIADLAGNTMAATTFTAPATSRF